MAEGIDVDDLGQRLRQVREQRQLTLLQVSKATGISVPTLSRVERGGSNDVEAGTLVTLAKWMRVPIHKFAERPAVPAVPGGQTPENTPEAVELYLRADKNLDRKTASLLADMFRVAYDRLSKEGSKKKG
jgi:transcriptional regulator with XRE-family HTH domain